MDFPKALVVLLGFFSLALFMPSILSLAQSTSANATNSFTTDFYLIVPALFLLISLVYFVGRFLTPAVDGM